MLQIGVFDDFKGRRTLLFWTTDAAPLERLQATLGAAADTRKPVTLTDLPWVTGVGGVRLEVSVHETGGVFERPLDDGLAVELQLSPEQVRELAQKVDRLSGSQGAGHHDFDPTGAGFQIMISKGEYPARMTPEPWPAHYLPG